MLKKVDYYVGKAALLGIVVVWLVLVIIVSLLNLLSELPDTQGDYGALDALWFTVMIIPRVAYQVFPYAALVGALMGVGGLAATNELVAFRAAGVSRLRLTLAAMGGALALTLPTLAVGEWVAPKAEQQARAYRLSEIAGRVNIGGQGGFWIKDGDNVVNIQNAVLEADKDHQNVAYRDVSIYRFGNMQQLVSKTYADTALHDGEAWRLSNARRVEFAEQHLQVSDLPQLVWPSQVNPQLLDAAVTRPKYMSMRALWNWVSYLRHNDLDARHYLSAFWEKAVFPLTVLALVMVSMPFVFGSARHHNLGLRLFIGVLAGGVFVMLSRAARNSGDAYQLSPAVTALAPSLLLVIVSLYILRRGV